MISLSYELEGLAHRFWSLRYEHYREFEGYQEAGHQAIISYWQAEYALWSDTVLDFQENGSGVGNSDAASGQVISTTAAPLTYASVQMPQYPDTDDIVQQGRPMQLQSPPLQDAPHGQGMPGRQSAQDMQLQHPSTPNSQAAFGPPLSAGNVRQHTNVGQQQQQPQPWEAQNQGPIMPQRGPLGTMSNVPNGHQLPQGSWSNLNNGHQSPLPPLHGMEQHQAAIVLPGWKLQQAQNSDGRQQLTPGMQQLRVADQRTLGASSTAVSTASNTQRSL